MTLQEILKAKGLDDKAVESVIGEMKQNKIFTSAEENIDIRYGKLKADFDTLTKQHGEANSLIDQMKKDNAGNANLQTKITDYEQKIKKMETELQQTKIDAALKVALLEAKVTDVDYLTYKIKEKGEVKLGDDGKIKGIDDTISGLKNQYPQHFSSDSKKKIDENKLPDREGDENKLTRKELLSKPYSERMKFYQDDPEAYEKIMHPDN